MDEVIKPTKRPTRKTAKAIKLTTPQINRSKNGSLSTTDGLVGDVFIRPIKLTKLTSF